MVVPAGLSYTSLTQGDGATANYVASEGRIYFAFTSNSGTNVTKETTVMTVTFNISGNANSVKLDTEIVDIYDQNYTTVSYKVIGEDIKIK